MEHDVKSDNANSQGGPRTRARRVYVPCPRCQIPLRGRGLAGLRRTPGVGPGEGGQEGL